MARTISDGSDGREAAAAAAPNRTGVSPIATVLLVAVEVAAAIAAAAVLLMREDPFAAVAAAAVLLMREDPFAAVAAVAAVAVFRLTTGPNVSFLAGPAVSIGAAVAIVAAGRAPCSVIVTFLSLGGLNPNAGFI